MYFRDACDAEIWLDANLACQKATYWQEGTGKVFIGDIEDAPRGDWEEISRMDLYHLADMEVLGG